MGELYRIGKEDASGSQIIFDSLSDFLDHAEQNPNGSRHRGSFYDAEWCGAASLADALQQARNGLPADGLKALSVADRKADAYKTLDAYRADAFFDTAGAYVDMGRYVEGEPSCMVDYQFQQVNEVKPVVTVVVNVAVLARVSVEAIRERGLHTVAAIKAIETSGRSVEVWADMTSKCMIDSNKTIRVSTLIKRAGDVFDLGKFMFCMTSPAMFRVFGFNAREGIDTRVRDLIGGGSTRTDEWRLTDYPEGAAYMRALSPRDKPEQHARQILVDTGLAV